jgi:hypothetical protein
VPCSAGEEVPSKANNALSYFKKWSEEPPVDPKMAEDDAVDPDDPQPGHSSRQ